jgi:hypothetical protein
MVPVPHIIFVSSSLRFFAYDNHGESHTHKPMLLNNKTRWSSKYNMLNRFCRIHEHIVSLSEIPDLVDIDNFNTTQGFKRRIESYTTYMQAINHVTILIQKQCLSLASCRNALDMLDSSVLEGINDPRSEFYKCKFESSRTSRESNLVPDPDFEEGVVKIQKGHVDQLTDAEKAAVSYLLKTGVDAQQGDENQNAPPRVTFEERLHKESQRNNKGGQTTGYKNTDFIFGSAAEVERMWSLMKNILTKKRQGMMPQLAKALVFLKVNQRFWGMGEVVREMGMARSSM